MEDYYPLKLKRKDPEDVNDDFSDFYLSSPARKIRRLDAEFQPIVEEDECEVPIGFDHCLLQKQSPSSGTKGGIRIEELPTVPINEEKAIVLFNPNTLPRSPSSFSVSVNPHLISSFKNQIPWSNQLNPWGLCDDGTSEMNNPCPGNGCLAVVPWVPSQLSSEPVAELPSEIDNPEMMDAQEVEEETMDIEYAGVGQSNVSESCGTNLNEGFYQWQQQHCLIPQTPPSAPAPIVWFR
ncbi:hypothetical protein OROGR_018593 [Orobanche gracilis]